MSSGLRVNHQRRAAIAENRVAVIAHRDARRDHRRLRRAICGHREIRHVARVRAFRILQAMMLHVRIEVAAGGRERRAFAFRHRVHVDGVLARRKIHQVEANFHAVRRRRKFRGADAFPCASFSWTLTDLLAQMRKRPGNNQRSCNCKQSCVFA